MNRSLLGASALCISLLAVESASAQSRTPIADNYRATADKIIAAALADSSAWNRLAELTDKFGHRLSGSASLERAIDWILVEMKKDQLANVRGEPVMVPKWVRGEEWARLESPRAVPLNMIGLGRSIGTPAKGITADVLVVTSFDELTKRASEAKGKIVLFDVPFTGYGQTVRYRGRAAIEASKVGGVAALIRSVSSGTMQNPHTGAMGYDSTVAQIPAAALSVEDAAMLHRMSDRGEKVRVTLKMSAQTMPDAPSRNIVAEIVGSEKPNEIVVLGGHIDSWDVGVGAMDDGGGVVASWEAVKLIKRLGLKPKRTIRVVAWTNEENGSRGAEGYRDAHRNEIAQSRHGDGIGQRRVRSAGCRHNCGRGWTRDRCRYRDASQVDRCRQRERRWRRCRYSADWRTWCSDDVTRCRWYALLLVSPQQCRHDGQARPARAGRVCGVDGGVRLCGG